MTTEKNNELSWIELIGLYKHPRVLTLLFLGFSAGLPYLLLFSTLSAWLSTEDVSKSTIGFFSWIGITYSIKVFWAPIIDTINLPVISRLLGRRRSWMLIAQIGIALGLFLMSQVDIKQDLLLLAIVGFIVAFSAATQDIVIDAYRIESAPVKLQAAMAASYILGYRLALLVSGGGALIIAASSGWEIAYISMAGLMLVGIITTLTIREPDVNKNSMAYDECGKNTNNVLKRFTSWFRYAVMGPFKEFYVRNGGLALLILLFISIFRISDITMGVMANPFYIDLGFTLKEIAFVIKLFGFFMTILGAGLGGVLVMRIGLYQTLFIGAIMVVITNALFALFAISDANIYGLAVLISADNISGGIAVTAFIAYLSSLTNVAYTATQYALFSSLMTLPAKIIAGFSGVIVESINYPLFFLYSAILGIPSIFLVLYLFSKSKEENNALKPE